MWLLQCCLANFTCKGCKCEFKLLRVVLVDVVVVKCSSWIGSSKGSSFPLSGHGAELNSGIALDFLVTEVCQSCFCSAEHKVLLAWGGLTFSGAE